MFDGTKICRNCAHSRVIGASRTSIVRSNNYFCNRIKGTEPTIDIITGEVKTRGYLKCIDDRANDNGCGLDGKYYKER